MAENSSHPQKLPDNLVSDKKKVRRGQRANKKPNPMPVGKSLVPGFEKLEIQPKKRQLRSPKIPGEVQGMKIGTAEDSGGKNRGLINPIIVKNHLEYTKANSEDRAELKSPLAELKAKRNRKKFDKGNRDGAKSERKNSRVDDASLGVCNRVRSREQSAGGPSRKKIEKNGIDRNKFEAYMAEELSKGLLKLQSVENGSIKYVEGNIRINPRFFREAYIAMPDNEPDILIDGVRDRNRALEGDLVIVKINPREKWRGLKSSRPQKTGVVICLLEKIHPRKIVGFLKPMPDNNKRIALFCPRDHRVPRLNIDAAFCPENFFNQPDIFAKTLFFAEITTWNDVRFAHGKILERIGEAGDLKTESKSILMENDLEVTPYGPELTRNLPPSDYQPTLEDIDGREDWRKECIFTIDPATAQDLDDALSCKELENGNFEVGVHISDVTHYLDSNSALDLAVSKRATTIYLSDTVFHMLPKQLCNVCSLLPGSDKLALSVIFEMTKSGEVVSHRFAKTVINSCCQFAYEHAQMMIQNPLKIWSEDELPKICGPYKISEISAIVNNLNNIAVNMREARVNKGSLRIDQPKLHVLVDRESGLPVSFTLEEQKDSNRLIEEFMLLANMTAATHLYKKFPNLALLRRHQEPLLFVLTETQSMLEKLGIHIEVESAGALQASLLRYQPDPEIDSDKDLYLAACRSRVLNALCSKSMVRAKYFCTSAEMEDLALRHYALNVPLYTHFTSPIRRYSDCVVHRLLYTSMKNEAPNPSWTPQLCARIAENCNKQKYNAKRAQETSSELFLTTFLGLVGPLDATAVAVDVKDRSVHVIVCEMGITLRIYSSEIEKFAKVYHENNDDVQTLKIAWKKSNVTQVINIFTIMNIRVSKHPETNRLHGELLEPERVGF